MTTEDANWEAYAHAFAWDGSLRDIYVGDIDLTGWARFAKLLGGLGHPLSFSGRWSGNGFPENIGDLFPTDPELERTTLVMTVDGVQVNCHFFIETEIELDIDPRDVNTPSRLAAVFGLMRSMADTLDREVVLTPEDLPDAWIFRCRPGCADIEHSSEHGAST